VSASAFLQIQTALAAAIGAALPGVPVWVNRTRALSREEPLAVLLRLESARDDQGPLGVRDWQTTFEVELVGRGDSGADPATAVDGSLQTLWTAIVGLEAGANMDVAADPQIDWTFDAADTPLASALVRVTVRHRTAFETLSPRS